MSDGEAEVYSAHLQTQTSATSAGALLREARLAAGVHIESVAFSLKVPVSKIEALENDDFASLPDAVFARALTSSVCRALKIDPVPVLALLPQTKVHSLPGNASGVKATFRDGTERSQSSAIFSRLSWPLGLSVLVLLVGAAVLAWVPSEWLKLNFLEDSKGTTAVVALPLPAEARAPEQVLQTTENSVNSTRGGESEPVLAVDPTSASASTTPEPEPKHGTPRLQLSARGETWVQVKDAKGVVILERILRTGESVTVDQPDRLSVVVGRADVTDVHIAGKTLDIVSAARENVARFEVKP